MFLWRRKAWLRMLGGLAVAMMLTLFIAAPGLDRLTCSDDHATVSASQDHGLAKASPDEAGGKAPCGYCHHGSHWLAPVMTPQSEPVSIAYRELVRVTTTEVAWPAFLQERPPRA